MAKFSRFDPQNKNRNKHKNAARKGDRFKRIKLTEKPGRHNTYEDDDDDYESFQDSEDMA